MKTSAKHSTLVSIETPTSASALFDAICELLAIPSDQPRSEYANELFHLSDDDLPVQVGMEFGDDDGKELVFEGDSEWDDGFVSEHNPYIEITFNTAADYTSTNGGKAKDVHALVLQELAEILDDKGIEWGYYSDADEKYRWISGEFADKFGNPSKGEFRTGTVTPTL